MRKFLVYLLVGSATLLVVAIYASAFIALFLYAWPVLIVLAVFVAIIYAPLVLSGRISEVERKAEEREYHPPPRLV